MNKNAGSNLKIATTATATTAVAIAAMCPERLTNESFNKNSETIKTVPTVSLKSTTINNKSSDSDNDNDSQRNTTTTTKLIASTAIETTIPAVEARKFSISNDDQATNTNSLNQINLRSRRQATANSTIRRTSQTDGLMMMTTATTTTTTTTTTTMGTSLGSSLRQKSAKATLRRTQSTPAFKCADVSSDGASAVNVEIDGDHLLSTRNPTVNSAPVDRAEEATDALKTIDSEQRFGCAHYKRRAMFVTPCCNKFYKCRFCHDENETHHFDRKTLTELICSLCNTRQKVQESCEKCGVRFGKYTCLICNLFDDSDCTYHCNACGICRIGRAENFFHCEVCNMCLPIQLKIDGHRCVENISRSHCPVCLGDIHTSRIPCHIPDCGHLLHKMCFDQLLTSGHYACPICQTSLIDMTALWEYLDAQATLLPIPKKYENQKISIFCNDCHKTSKTKFHFIGLKCMQCGAYNTTQEVKRRMSLVTDEPSTA